jgi:hypothetical protein
MIKFLWSLITYAAAACCFAAGIVEMKVEQANTGLGLCLIGWYMFLLCTPLRSSEKKSSSKLDAFVVVAMLLGLGCASALLFVPYSLPTTLFLLLPACGLPFLACWLCDLAEYLGDKRFPSMPDWQSKL